MLREIYINFLKNTGINRINTILPLFRTIALFLFFSVSILNSYAQNYDIATASTMSPLTDVASGSTFSDSNVGAPPNYNYGNNEDYTATFFSSIGNTFKFTFTSFNTRNEDILYIYDGPDYSTPIGSYKGNELQGFTISSSGSYITFRFISDGSFTRTGWLATIQYNTCPPITTSPILPSVDHQCAGKTINYSVDLHVGSTYTWTVLYGTPSSVTAFELDNIDITWDTPNETGIINVDETSSCGSTSSSILFVDIYPVPTPSISGLLNVCPNASGVPYSTSSTGNSFTWNVTNGTFSDFGDNISVNWGTVDGIIQVTETDPLSGCFATTPEYNVQVADVTPPVISDCPSDIILNVTPGTCSNTATWTEPTANDECEGAMTFTTRTHAPGSAFPSGTATVTYKFTDAASNTSICSFDVTVNDNENPIAICKDITVELDGTGNASIIGSDIDGGSTDNCGIATLDAVPNSFTIADLDANPVTLIVTDDNGRTASCNATVTVIENVPPVALCKDITVYLDATGNVVITGADIDNGSSDSDGIASLDASPNSFTCSVIGPNSVTLTVTDNAGMSSTCNSTVTVVDNLAPSLTCPSNYNVNTDPGICGAVINYVTPVGTDNCSGSITIQTAGLPSGSTFPVGTTTNTFQVTDGSGNVTTCSFTITVADNEGPVITLPVPPVISTGPGPGCTATIPVIAVTVTDNCTATGSITVTQLPVAGTPVGPGITPVTITATDLEGNISFENIDVTVNDGVAPVITSPADASTNLDASCQAPVPDFLSTLVVTDNCTPVGSITKTQNPAAGTLISGAASTTVTIQATDASSNTSSVSVLFITSDVTPPVVNCKNATLYLNATGNATLTAADIDNGSFDNCGSLSYSLSRSAFTCADIGAPVLVTLTATDGSLNSANCNAQVTVLDNLPPVVSVKTYNLVLNDLTGNGTLLASDVDNGTTDNCGAVSLSVSPNTFDCTDVGTQNVTLTATDSHSNSSSQSVNITVSTGLTINDAKASTCDAFGPFSRFTADITGGKVPYTYLWDCIEPVNMFVEIIFPVPPFFIFSNTSTIAQPYFNNLVPDGAYNIQLTVTDDNGCSAVYNFVFNKSSGVVEDNLSQNNSQACVNEIKTYTVPAGATSYSWTIENGTIQSGGTSNAVTVQWGAVSPGKLTATIVKDDILGFSCTSYHIENVTINPNPTPALNAYSASVCENSEYTYTLTSTFSSYGWIVTNGTITEGGSATDYFVKVRWGAFAAGSVLANVTNANCTGSVTANVTINALPAASISSSDADNTFCSGASVTFTALPTGSGETYQFRVNSSVVKTGASNTYTSTTLTNGQIVDVIVTNVSICSATSAGITNTVVAFPVPTLTSSDADNIFCAGTGVTFTAGGGTNFNFRINGASVQDGPSPTYLTFTLMNGQVVDVIVSNATDCSATSASITNTVVVAPTPTLSSSDADDKFCAGTIVTFTAGGGTTYNFRINSISVQDGASTTFTTTSLTNGDNVDVIVSNGTCTANSVVITNIVNPIPTPTLTNDTGNSICAGTTVTFTAGGGTNYNFRVNGVSKQNGLSDTYITWTLTNGQIVDVIVTNAGSCSATSAGITMTVTTPPAISINYAGSPYCSTTGSGQAVTLSGPSGGTYSASPAGLSINSSTGVVTPNTSTPGSYTVTYSYPVGGGCPPVTATAPVTITPLPVATFSYPGSPYCSTDANPSPVFSGGGVAGTFSPIQPGLVFINTATGQVNLAASTPGTYNVVNTIAAFAGCGIVTASNTITIAIPPTATISYAGTPFCSSVSTAQPVTLTGTGVYTGGAFTYSGPGTLSIHGTTGAITPSTSTPGTYTVTYTLLAGPCTSTPTTTLVTITAVKTATISYSGSPYCTSDGTSKTVTLTGDTGGTFSAAPAGLTIDPSTGSIIPSSSAAGAYIVTYTIPAGGGCSAVMATAPVTITAAPTASINYVGAPFCSSASGTRAVTLTGTGAYTGGNYSEPTGNLTLNTSNGDITPSTSLPGTYTVTYTSPSAGGCAPVTATTSVTITALPVASISYAGAPFCTTVTTPQPVTITGTTGGTFSALPAGLSLNTTTGEIVPSTSTPATFTVTYTIAAAGGCSQVTATTNVTITELPTVSISYTGSSFCTNLLVPQTVTINGTGDYLGGNFSSNPVGLDIDPVSGIIYPNSSTPGNYIVIYDTGPSGGCASVIATTNVAIALTPGAPTGSATQSFCAIDLPDLSDIIVTGSGIQWYDASTGGNLLVSTTLLVTGTTYYASQTISGCESDTRLAVTATVSDPAPPTGSSSQTFCSI
ncbi:MAG TPA: HYR domain-containing protein, partial [Bacteroidales bacterium]|nr:HYR domain-containing protein [Bacteroidales bacterium]